MTIQIQNNSISQSFFSFLAICSLFLLYGTVNGATKGDFDGDGKADIAVFRPSDGFWYIAKSSGGYSSIRWGLSNDYLVPGDYDGDGKTDVGVYRCDAFVFSPEPRNCFFYILKSSDNGFLAKQWGIAYALSGDAPLSFEDYDGDGKTDFAVYGSSDALPTPVRYNILRSSDNATINTTWGFNTDYKVSDDYDGDGKTDLAVFRGNNFNTPADQQNSWFILNSSNNVMRVVRFGLGSDRHTPADYDGDGKADIAVFRPSNGTWYRINSRDDSFRSFQFGSSGDLPAPADYDGDGKTDIAVWRASTGSWFIQRSTEGFYAQQFGALSDIAIPTRY